MKSLLRDLLAQTQSSDSPLSNREMMLGWIAFAILAVIVILLASSGTEEDEVL